MQLDLDAPELELQHRRDPLDALDHAGGDSSEKQLRRIERIRPAIHIRIERDRGALGCGLAAVAVDAAALNTIFEHRLPLKPFGEVGALGSPPACTTLPSMTMPGVEAMPYWAIAA